MSFFDQAPAENKESTFDKGAAEWLRRLVVARNVNPASWSISKWAHEIRLLRSKHKESEIEYVLRMIEETPEIKPTSARWLRRNFDWLLERANATVPSSKERTPLEIRIFRRLDVLIWPEQTKGYEQLVRTSVQTMKRLYAGLDDMGRTSSPLADAASWLLDTMPDIEEFVVEWVQRIHSKVCDREDWNGKLEFYAIRFSSKRFTEIGTRLAARYSSDPGLWKALLKELEYESPQS